MSRRTLRTRAPVAVVAALASLLGLTTACTEQVVLDALPPEILWVVSARTTEGGAARVSPLMAAGDVSLSLTVGHDESMTLWGFGAELQPLMTGVPQERWSTEPMRAAVACDTTLPTPRWSTQVSAARSVAKAADAPAWTSSWLDEQCPQVEGLRADVRCVPDTCGVVEQRGCALDIDLTACAKGTLRGRLMPDGAVCIRDGATPTLGTCRPLMSKNPFASTALLCEERAGVECEVDLVAAPRTPVEVKPVLVADAAPASVGPDINDFGIKEIALRRMRAIPWGEQELLVTWWPWRSRDACTGRNRPLPPVEPNLWSLVDIYGRRLTASGTTSPCIADLGKVGPREAVALARLDDGAFALTRLDAQLREVQRHLLASDQLIEGKPLYMVVDQRSRPIVMYTRPVDGVQSYSYVAYDAVTLQPAWRSPPLAGTPTHLLYADDKLWTADQGDRWIESLPVGGTATTDEYMVPVMVRTPLEILGMLPPQRAGNRDFMAVLSRDEPALLVSQDGTRGLRRDTPYQVSHAFPTAIGVHHGAPVVTLMASDDAGGFAAYVTTVSAEHGRWTNDLSPLELRSASELVTDAAGNAWVLAPWDGVVARLP